MILEQINGPQDINSCPGRSRTAGTGDKTFLIEKISHTGGHLASNLGVVELAIADVPDL